MKRSSAVALVVGFAAGISLAFTNQAAPARHPALQVASTITPQIYMNDPYLGGASVGVANVVGKIASCDTTSALTLLDDGGSVEFACLPIGKSFIDGGQLFIPLVAQYPVPPPPEGQSYFSFQPGAGAPAQPDVIDSAIGLPIPIGAWGDFLNLDSAATWNKQTCRIHGFGTSNVTCDSVGGGSATQAGASGGNAWAQGAGWMNTKRRWLLTAGGVANTNTGQRWSSVFMTRGNCPGCGGFIFSTRVGLNAVSSTQRVLIGLTTNTGALTNTAEPSTFANTAYVGADEADTNLGCCANDNSGSSTCQTLGANYPKALVDAGYDVLIASQRDGGIVCSVYSWPTRSWSTKYLVTDLPQDSVQMNWQVNMNTGSGSTAISFNWMDLFILFGTGG